MLVIQRSDGEASALTLPGDLPVSINTDGPVGSQSGTTTTARLCWPTCAR